MSVGVITTFGGGEDPRIGDPLGKLFVTGPPDTTQAALFINGVLGRQAKYADILPTEAGDIPLSLASTVVGGELSRYDDASKNLFLGGFLLGYIAHRAANTQPPILPVQWCRSRLARNSQPVTIGRWLVGAHRETWGTEDPVGRSARIRASFLEWAQDVDRDLAGNQYFRLGFTVVQALGFAQELQTQEAAQAKAREAAQVDEQIAWMELALQFEDQENGPNAPNN